MKKDRLLKEAAEWRLISLLFDCPTGDWFKQVAALGKHVNDLQLKKAAKAAQTEASEGLFHSVFGPGGPAPGREISYRGWVQPGYMISELSLFYDAFGYKPATGEVPDHVAIETGFIAYLRLKEQYARECGDDESAEITADAANNFIAEHLSKYTQTLNKLLAASGIEYLTSAGAALFKRVGPDKDKDQKVFLPMLEDEDESMFGCAAVSM